MRAILFNFAKNAVTTLCLSTRDIWIQTNKHDIIVTEAFRAALLRVKKSQQVKVCALYAGLNKVDADWFNRNDVTANPNARWSAHHLPLELPWAGAEVVDD